MMQAQQTSFQKSVIAMRTNHISALLVTLALAAPLWAGQHGGRASSRPPVSNAQTAPRAQAVQRGGAAPVQRNAPPAQFQTQITRPPTQPHQIIRGQGPHNGDWLRNSMQLPAQEQQRKLEQDQHFRQLPQQRQEQLKSRLQNFNSMPPQQRQRVLNRMEMIEHLQPEQQRHARTLFEQFRTMDPQRKDMMRRTLRQMRTMPPDARDRLLNSPESQSRYSPQEIQMLHGFNDIGFVGPEQP